MKKTLLAILMLSCIVVFAQQRTKTPQLNIIPEPVSIKATDGSYTVSRSTKIYITDATSEKTAQYLSDYYNKNYGYPLQITKKKTDKDVITLKNTANGQITGGYNLTVSEKGIEIAGNEASGVFYGVQTLIQLLPTRAGVLPIIKGVEITDYPRFEYRGMHLDVVRHFYPVEYVKRYIDFLALHKMNYFHWHLTDDQGWRIQMNCHPELTQKGAYRDGEIIGLYPGVYKELPYGGYYTHEQAREVVQYAAERFITVIPEIDIPGHCMAVLATFPQFSTVPNEEKYCARTWGIFNKFNNVLAPTPEVFKFLDDVFSELCDIFPGQYIHVGGDECAKKWWKESEQTQKFMRENNIADQEALQSYFIRHVQKTVVKKGKTLIGWDEILQGGLAPDAIVMSWQGIHGGVAAAKNGHRVIMTPSGYSYFNNMQSRNQTNVTHKGYIPLDKVYNYNIIPDELSPEEAKMIIGAQACLWTEYYPTTWKLECALFPRLSALAENVWSQKKDWEHFKEKMPSQFDRYDLWGIRYSEAFFTMYDVVHGEH
ncbi:MAG: beta-N-acetylhexosaminidase [Flavobacteriales bacterium]|nr:beta-N-acetylhexosaminidase [Flavobacteriales bacterium]